MVKLFTNEEQIKRAIQAAVDQANKMKKKSIHELAKQFPDKTYRQLEKYRDADRWEEAQRILIQDENEALKEGSHEVE
tara:strand:- start:27 stop:260 length:234 start_codon:yes stop_codon:yes gene_type:complete